MLDPVSDADLEHIAESVSRYAVPGPEIDVVIGSRKKTTAGACQTAGARASRVSHFRLGWDHHCGDRKAVRS